MSLVVVTPNVLVTNPQALPAADVASIIATAKTSGKVNCASGSNGSAGHLPANCSSWPPVHQ